MAENEATILPYYVSRAVLSLVLSGVVLGFTWKAAAWRRAFLASSSFYLHSGWFEVDLAGRGSPCADERGREIRGRRSLQPGERSHHLCAPYGDSHQRFTCARGRPLAMALGAFVYSRPSSPFSPDPDRRFQIAGPGGSQRRSAFDSSLRQLAESETTRSLDAARALSLE